MPNAAIRRHRTYAQSALTADQQYQNTLLGFGPELYYPLVESSGTVADNRGSLGSGADGAYGASDIAGAATGPFGAVCPLFVPADLDYMNPYTSSLNSVFTTDDSSFFGWYKYGGTWSTSTAAYIAQFRLDANNRLLIYKNVANTLRFYMAGTGTVADITINVNTIGIDDANWHSFLVVWNTTGNASEVWLDGTSRATSTAAARSGTGLSSSFCGIGADDSTPASTWDGSIAHFGWVTSILDGTDATTIHNGGPV